MMIWVYTLFSLLYRGVMDEFMTIEKVAALVTVATAGVIFGGWIVTNLIAEVIKKEVGKILTRLDEKLQDLDRRLLRVEIHSGLDGRFGNENAKGD